MDNSDRIMLINRYLEDIKMDLHFMFNTKKYNRKKSVTIKLKECIMHTRRLGGDPNVKQESKYSWRVD